MRAEFKGWLDRETKERPEAEAVWAKLHRDQGAASARKPLLVLAALTAGVVLVLVLNAVKSEVPGKDEEKGAGVEVTVRDVTAPPQVEAVMRKSAPPEIAEGLSKPAANLVAAYHVSAGSPEEPVPGALRIPDEASFGPGLETLAQASRSFASTPDPDARGAGILVARMVREAKAAPGDWIVSSHLLRRACEVKRGMDWCPGVLRDLESRAHEVYMDAYTVKSDNPAEALDKFLLVMAMTEEHDENHLKAKARVAELGWAAEYEKLRTDFVGETQELARRCPRTIDCPSERALAQSIADVMFAEGLAAMSSDPDLARRKLEDVAQASWDANHDRQYAQARLFELEAAEVAMPAPAGSNQTAIAQLRAAVDQGGQSNPELHYRLGLAYLSTLGRFAIAIKELRTAVDLTPNCPDYLEALGDALVANNEFVEAGHMYEEVVSLDHNRSRVLGKIGDALRKNQGPEKALSAYQRQLEADPSATGVYLKIGKAYDELGKKKEAAAAFKKLVAADPSNAEAWKYLGYDTKGSDSIEAFQKYLQLSPDAADRQEVADLIENIKAGGLLPK